MDLSKAIKELYAEKEKLEQAIALLEGLKNGAGSALSHLKAAKRRGRKAMGPEERKQVSARMRAYWAARRNGRNPPGGKSRLSIGR
jgi:hypothetical protein